MIQRFLFYVFLLTFGLLHFILVFMGGLFVIEHFGLPSLSTAARNGLIIGLGIIALAYPVLAMRLLEKLKLQPRTRR